MSTMEQAELLAKLRGRLAHTKQVKPYVIFKDTEMEDILLKCPKTLEQLSAIKGFPPGGARVTKWGQSIIDIFNRPEKIEDFETTIDKDGDPVAKTVVKKMTLF